MIKGLESLLNILKNKLAGILIHRKVIQANYTADPGDGQMTLLEVEECIEDNPRLLEPFLMAQAIDPIITNETDLPETMKNFIESLRCECPNGIDYQFANYKKVLNNLKTYKELNNANSGNHA